MSMFPMSTEESIPYLGFASLPYLMMVRFCCPLSSLYSSDRPNNHWTIQNGGREARERGRARLSLSHRLSIVVGLNLKLRKGSFDFALQIYSKINSDERFTKLCAYGFEKCLPAHP